VADSVTHSILVGETRRLGSSRSAFFPYGFRTFLYSLAKRVVRTFACLLRAHENTGGAARCVLKVGPRTGIVSVLHSIG
jgi:hypothetical protein